MGQEVGDKEGHFENYTEYSRTLRSWLVAYGIGGPVLLLLNKDAPQTLAKSPHIKTVVTLFVAGVCLQILLAFINKWAAWQMYMGAIDHKHRDNKTYAMWFWVNEQSWIDLCCDIGALVAFAIATWLSLTTLLGDGG